MSFDLNSVLGQIGKDKGINKTVLIEAVESAMLSAARKHYGHNLNLEARFEEDIGQVRVVMYRVVVATPLDAATQISLEHAKELDPGVRVGDELGQVLETEELGRIAAQTAKQVIAQKLRDAERGVIYDEFKNSKGQLINGIVQRYERGNVIVNLGRTEAVLPKREQILKERYRQGDRIRGMILDIDRSTRGPQVILTRSHPDFLMKLFELEVPEIADGVVTIKGVAREPGERAKVAVHTKDDGVDPVGACVGVKGSRVMAVSQELRGEKIDIVVWTPDDPSYVARALSPAEITRVVVDEEAHTMEVIVNDDHLSLAIGRRGQNVKLASKLTGWRIDVRSVSAAEEESKRARESLGSIPGIAFTEVELLFQDGYRSYQAVADANPEDLVELEGFTAERVTDLISKANECVKDREGLDEVSDSVVTDIHRLVIEPSVREALLKAGYASIQNLIEVDDEELANATGIDLEKLSQLRSVIDQFLRDDSIKRQFGF
jgi:transcription termination/antitermination protein NusA